MSQSRATIAHSACCGALLFVAQAAPALARAGGGQHFGGGGHGSGGGYGGGSGLFSLWPLFFFGHGSLSGIILLFVIFYLYQQMQSRRTAPWMPLQGYGAAPQAAGVLQTSQVQDTQTLNAGLADIKARDPGFDQTVFLDRAQTAFFKVQEAWAARNQDLAREAMSDSLYERHKMQTDQLIAARQVDVLQNIVIGNARIVEVEPGRPFDSISVAFTASMTDYTIDESSGRIVDGSQYAQTFTEKWTFIRRSDVRSQVGATTLSATCPSCGAPLQASGGKCNYCGAFVRTSSSDWVVDTIAQVA